MNKTVVMHGVRWDRTKKRVPKIGEIYRTHDYPYGECLVKVIKVTKTGITGKILKHNKIRRYDPFCGYFYDYFTLVKMNCGNA